VDVQAGATIETTSSDPIHRPAEPGRKLVRTKYARRPVIGSDFS
jgi:hypothetical protein